MNDRTRRLVVILLTLGGAYAVGRVMRPLMGLTLPEGLWIYGVTLLIFVVLGRYLDGVLRSRGRSGQMGYATSNVPVHYPQQQTSSHVGAYMCEGCGAAMTLGHSFCAECGHPVRSMERYGSELSDSTMRGEVARSRRSHSRKVAAKSSVPLGELRFCARCGTRILADDSFCEKCGTPKE